LWHHIQAWDGEPGASGARRLLTGPLLVTHGDLAHQVLVGAERYREQSAFLRTRSFDPLPGPVRNTVIKGLMTAVAAHDRDPAAVPRHVFTGRRSLRTQEWGIWWMRYLFRNALALDRPPAVDACIDRFVQRKILGDDVGGRFRRMNPTDRDELHNRAGAEIERAAGGAAARNDLVDVVAGVDFDLPTIERGELYLRLVHSVISFTGTALEWAVLLAATRDDFRSDLRAGRDVRQYLLEAQRLYPTAWRLVRVAATDHEVGGEPVTAGDDIIIATATLHRSADHWPDSKEYLPCRWARPEMARERAFAPFGRGRGMCPGREVAFEVIHESLRWIFDNHTVTVGRRAWRTPYVRSIVAPPRVRIRVRPAVRESAA
jgi:hypothetical protein